MNDTTPTQVTEFVFRRLADPVQLFGTDIPGWVWLILMAVILVVGVAYVVLMYLRDSQAVGAWAIALAALRLSVYALLAAVFLLPAVQTWELTEARSRVAVLIDTSGSVTQTKDDRPSETVSVEKLPTRQDKVLDFLNRTEFVKRLEERNPVFAYRFGRALDEDYFVFTEGTQVPRRQWEQRAQNPLTLSEINPWARQQWADWLKPEFKASAPEGLKDKELEEWQQKQDSLRRSFAGTNLGDSLLALLNREAPNMVQGIVVFSDGRSNEGSSQAFKDVAERAQKANIPIFVVAVGEDLPKIRIDTPEVRVPDQVRPDDSFRAAVEVSGEGLANQEFPLFLDVTRVRKNSKGEDELLDIELVPTKSNGEPTGDPAINLGNKVTLEPPEKAKFKPGTPPHAQVEFQIDAAALAKAAGKAVPDGGKVELKDDAESVLRFVARVPKDPREIFVGKEHVSEPADVRVVKRPLRILLFSSGSGKDFQFVNTMLIRESDKKRVELCIYLQPPPGRAEVRTGRVLGVPPDRLLTQFPNRLADEESDKPDEKFYNLSAYDLILAFDPDWTQLSEDQLKLVEKWVGTHGGGLIVVGGPVNTLQLARPGSFKDKLKPILDLYPVVLQDSRIHELERNTTEPWRLNFPGAAPEMEFLVLEEDAKVPLAGWEEFFTGKPKKPDDKPLPAVRGFFNYYPVQRAKDSAIVVATFADPRARLQTDNSEQPFIVTAKYGPGRVVWLGAAEFWRLRMWKEAYHERFWSKLSRFAGGANLARLNRRIVPVMARNFKANDFVTAEFRIFGRDMEALAEDVKPRPKLTLTLPKGVPEKEIPTEIELTPKQEQGPWEGWFTARFQVKSPGNYQIQLKVEQTGDTHNDKFEVKEANPELDNTRPDFEALYELAGETDEAFWERVKDQAAALKNTLRVRKFGPSSGATGAPKETADDNKMKLFFDLNSAQMIPSCIFDRKVERKSRGAVDDKWDDGLTLRDAEPPAQPVKISYVLMIAVALLSVEWLARKLLRLA